MPDSMVLAIESVVDGISAISRSGIGLQGDFSKQGARPVLEGPDQRHQIRAMMNGARGTCPRCGKGRLFSRYLSTQERCPECNEELSHHRADDFPAYLNIFIVGHVVVGLMMVAMNWLIMPLWGLVFLTAGIAVACSVLLMRPLKGIVIGAQWALRMHGFGGNED